MFDGDALAQPGSPCWGESTLTQLAQQRLVRMNVDTAAMRTRRAALTQGRPLSSNGTGYNAKPAKWLLKRLYKMPSLCVTHDVTVCHSRRSSVSFRIHAPVEPNEQEKQTNKNGLALYPVPLLLKGQVSARVTMSGTHQGPGAFFGAPPSGKRFEIQQMRLLRIVDGQLKDSWAVIDMLGWMQQLGVMPSRPAASGEVLIRGH